ncbi:MAG: hypothetical protein JSV25_02320 [Spirochaetota bacterium]|nr:MAG: hypothetical protein JSV25_02320 [Spirochaetota bacterium]
MAVDKEKKQAYNEELSQLKQKVEEVKKKIVGLEAQKENKNLNIIRASSLYIDLITIYCAMTDLSLILLGYKNETYLDIGRKSLYKAIITLVGIVSNFIDMPLGENYEILQELQDLSDEERLKMMRKIGYAISLLEDRYGKASKWKWSFVEIEGRYATVAKNLFDFRSYQQKNDPRIEGFDARNDYLVLVKDLLNRVSKRYREKYELTDHLADDMKKAIDYLRALKRVYILFSEATQAQNMTKQIELWSQKFEVDMKAKEKSLKQKNRDSLRKKGS